MAEPRYILDTGPLVAFANAGDSHHLWARGVLDALGEAPLTCEVVLAEACYLLRSSAAAVDQVLALPEQRRVVTRPVIDGTGPTLRRSVHKYWPFIDLADACVMDLGERHSRARIITTDVRDFRIYRRRNGAPFAIIHP